MPLLSRFRALRRGGPPVVEEHPLPETLHHPPAPPQPEAWSSPAPYSNDASPSQRYVQMAQDLRSSLPSTCRWLDPEDVKLVGEHPIAAGGFTDIWNGTHNNAKVVLKSYRCYMSFDVAQVIARFNNEVHVSSLLRDGNVDVALLVGVCSTEAHPFGLVYKYMENLDLRQYLKSEPNVERLRLLVGIARGLSHMHDMDTVHGNLQTTNVLIDKGGTPHIAGLGSASTFPHSTVWTARCGTGVARLSRNNTPESILPQPPESALYSSLPTKAGDIYGFGVVAWEVLTGRPPFANMTEIAATYSMLNGARPPWPNHHEISDRVWYMVERCWHNVPSKRMSVGEVVDLLEAEL